MSSPKAVMRGRYV